MVKTNWWSHVRHFKAIEFADSNVPGSGKYIYGDVLMLIDKTWEETSWPIVVHQAVDMEGTHGHSGSSYHLYKNGCKAIDFHFETEVSYRAQYNCLCRMGWSGLGFYPEWPNPGFHVDLRPIEETQHWVHRNGVYEYFFNFGE